MQPDASFPLSVMLVWLRRINKKKHRLQSIHGLKKIAIVWAVAMSSRLTLKFSSSTNFEVDLSSVENIYLLSSRSSAKKRCTMTSKTSATGWFTLLTKMVYLMNWPIFNYSFSLFRSCQPLDYTSYTSPSKGGTFKLTKVPGAKCMSHYVSSSWNSNLPSISSSPRTSKAKARFLIR